MQLRTLGGLELIPSSFTRPKPLLLLCYLALEGPKERRYIAELFWQGTTDPLNRLAVTLTRLRKADPGSWSADNVKVWTKLNMDAQALLAAMEGNRFEEVISLYCGPFLEGVYFDGWGSELSEWVYGTRDFLASQVKIAQLALAEAEAGEGKFQNAAKRAEAAYSVAQTVGLEPSDICRLHTLLLAAGNPHRVTLQKEAEAFRVKLLVTPDEARETLRNVSKVSRDIPNSLPVRGNSFVGRDRELTELATMLANEDYRLITVFGPAGVGKTRLALEVARRQLRLGRMVDGIYFVALDALTSASLILSRLAVTLGLKLQGQDEPLTQIARQIGNRHLMLVLDNYGHLLEGATVTSELLQRCPNLKLVATSRERLNVDEEWIFNVEGLAHPKGAAHTLEEGEYYDAPQLFLQRARQACPDFSLRGTDLPVIFDICRLVDGLPLGLELAATWVKVMSLAEIAQEIGRNLDVLTATTRNLPERHKSIKVAFEQSWKLLTPTEQEVLCKLSLFQGGFGREAASKVADATIPLLAALVDKSLLRINLERRYNFHPLLHRYTREKLNSNLQKLKLTNEKHAAYFLGLAEEAEPHLHDLGQIEWLERLEEELSNLRAALAWTEERRQIAQAMQLSLTLGEFCRSRGFLTEGRTLLANALKQLGAVEHAKVRARALTCAGALAWMQSDYSPAISLHQESLAISRELSDEEGVAASLHYLARVKVEQGDYALARSFYEESLSIDRRLESWCGVANTLQGLGLVVLGQGDVQLARALREEGLAISRKLGNKLRISEALHGLGTVAFYQGNLYLARSLYEESLTLSRDLRDHFYLINTLNKLGRVIIEQGDSALARTLLEESMRISQETGSRWGIIYTIESFASLAAARGDFKRTMRLWGAAETLREELGSPILSHDRPRYENDLAAALAQLGETVFRTEHEAGRALSWDKAIAYFL